MKRTALIFHHTDNDGYGAAKVCLDRCRALAYPDDDIICIPVTLNGGQIDFIEHQIRSYDTDECKIDHIFIVDLSIPSAEDIIRIGEVIREVNIGMHSVWIDHHKTSVDAHMELSKGIEYGGIEYNKALFTNIVLDTRCSAAKLAYETLISTDIVPQVIELISDHDTFTHDLEGSIEFFNGSGLFQLSNIKDPLWDDLFADGPIWGEHIDQIVSAGDIIGQYINMSICPMIGRNIQPFKLAVNSEHGVFYFNDCVAINSSWGNSAIFGDNGQGYKKYDICMKYFQNKNGTYTYTLYSDKYDITHICKCFGGGGHPGAGGFTIDRNLMDDALANKDSVVSTTLAIDGFTDDVIETYLERYKEMNRDWKGTGMVSTN